MIFEVLISILISVLFHHPGTQTASPCLSAPGRRGPTASGVPQKNAFSPSMLKTFFSSVNRPVSAGLGNFIVETLPVSVSALASMSLLYKDHQPLPMLSPATP